MRNFLLKKSANIEIAKYESDRQSVSESRMSNDKLASQLKKHSVLKVHLAPKVHFALKVHSALEVHANNNNNNLFQIIQKLICMQIIVNLDHMGHCKGVPPLNLHLLPFLP